MEWDNLDPEISFEDCFDLSSPDQEVHEKQSQAPSDPKSGKSDAKVLSKNEVSLLSLSYTFRQLRERSKGTKMITNHISRLPGGHPRKDFNGFTERRDQRSVSGAFAELGRLVPTYPLGRKLSKLEILRLSIRYIRLLSSVLDWQDYVVCNAPQFQ